MTDGMAISIDGLRKVFHQTSSGAEIVAIDRLDLAIAPRELIAIVGQTGCGKSTLFDLLIGLEAPTGGEIRIGGKAPFADFDFFRGPSTGKWRWDLFRDNYAVSTMAAVVGEWYYVEVLIDFGGADGTTYTAQVRINGVDQPMITSTKAAIEENDLKPRKMASSMRTS